MLDCSVLWFFIILNMFLFVNGVVLFYYFKKIGDIVFLKNINDML